MPDTVETRLGTLRFADGFPDDATVEKVFDNLDFQHAVQALTRRCESRRRAVRRGTGTRGTGTASTRTAARLTGPESAAHGRC